MKRIPPIKAVMTAFPHSIDVDRSVDDARARMIELDIRHLPVVDGDDLVSVLTDRDIRLVLDPVLRKAARGDLRIGDVCSRDSACIVDRNEPLDQVLRHMAEKHADSALVVRHDKLVGIFTMTDACRCFGDLLQSLFPTGPGHDAA